jgi:hypothetical protein
MSARGRRAALAVATATLFAAMVTPSAGAATPVGGTFPPSGGAAQCGADRTFLQYSIPADGVITSWRFQADNNPPQLKLKIGRPTGTANQFTIVGDSDLKTPAINQLNAYPAGVSVRAGDLLGFYVTGGMGGLSDCLSGVPGAGTTVFTRLGEAVVNSTSTFNPSPDQQLDLAATLEPDCDADGLGDESQDGSVDCVSPDTTITKRPKPKVRKKKARFEFSSDAGATFQCSLNGAPFTPCASPLEVKAKKGRNELAVRATDPGGNVDATPATAGWKFKKKKK